MSLHVTRDLVQGSEEWHAARRGIVTASVVGKLISVGSPDASEVACPQCGSVEGVPCISASRKVPTPIKTHHDARVALASKQPPVYSVADNDTSRAVVATLVAERIADFTEDLPMTSDMWRGVDSEPIARDLYSRHHAPVEEVGFIRRDERNWTLGYSPDGLVGDDGLIEIKAPRAKTHVLTILADEVPAHYMPQLQAGLLVSGRDWIDFVSYCGGLPLWVKRVRPDQRWFDAISDACIAFETTAAEMVARFNNLTSDLPTTERIDFNAVELKLA